MFFNISTQSLQKQTLIRLGSPLCPILTKTPILNHQDSYYNAINFTFMRSYITKRLLTHYRLLSLRALLPQRLIKFITIIIALFSFLIILYNLILWYTHNKLGNHSPLYVLISFIYSFWRLVFKTKRPFSLSDI